MAAACTGQRAEPPPPTPPPPPVVAAVQQSVLLPGICEPSAATQGPFGDVWVADDDQDDRLFLLTAQELSPRTVEAPHHKGEPAVKDIEGLSFDQAGHLWVMGSHSRSSRGKLGRRARLVSAAPSAPGQRVEGGSLWSDGDHPEELVKQLVAQCPSCTPDGSWADLNFEGLAQEPGTRALLLGARAPLLSDGRAWMAAVAPRGDLAVKRVHAVELGKRGVRALAPAPSAGKVWILAGPPQDRDTGLGFALYSWQPGREAELLARLPALPGSPEGLWPTDAHSAWLFVDEGDRLKQHALGHPDSPHRKVKKDGEVKFSCGESVPEDGTELWAHAVQVTWTSSPAPPAEIR